MLSIRRGLKPVFIVLVFSTISVGLILLSHDAPISTREAAANVEDPTPTPTPTATPTASPTPTPLPYQNCVGYLGNPGVYAIFPMVITTYWTITEDSYPATPTTKVYTDDMPPIEVTAHEDFIAKVRVEGMGKLKNPVNGFDFLGFDRPNSVDKWTLYDGPKDACSKNLIDCVTLAIWTGWGWPGTSLLGAGDKVFFEWGIVPGPEECPAEICGIISDRGQGVDPSGVDLYVGVQDSDYIGNWQPMTTIYVGRTSRGCP